MNSMNSYMIRRDFSPPSICSAQDMAGAYRVWFGKDERPAWLAGNVGYDMFVEQYAGRVTRLRLRIAPYSARNPGSIRSAREAMLSATNKPGMNIKFPECDPTPAPPTYREGMSAAEAAIQIASGFGTCDNSEVTISSTAFEQFVSEKKAAAAELQKQQQEKAAADRAARERKF